MKSIWLITPYDGNNLTVPWREPTEKFLGQPVEFEFMRRAPMMIPRWAFAELEAFCQRQHGCHVADYIAQQPLRAFSEYNAMGAFLYAFHRDKVHWINTDEVPESEWPALTVEQSWSYSGLTDEKRARFEQMLTEPESPIMQTKEGIWVLRNDTLISRWIEEHGSLQHDYQTLPEVLKEIGEGDYVVDCGAFVGDTAQPFLDRVGKDGAVLAIEPNPDAFECLQRNISNGKSRSVWCICAAVSDESADAFLDVVENAGGSSLGARGIPVKTVTIDSVVEGTSRCDFIKLDVEGYELRALKGAEQTINRFHPKLLIEINHGALERQGATAEEVYAWLRDHGYEWRTVLPPENQAQNTPQEDILATWKGTNETRNGNADTRELCNERRSHDVAIASTDAIAYQQEVTPWADKQQTLDAIRQHAQALKRFCGAPRHVSTVRKVLKEEGVTK